jgi:phospholipid N-methyltransferase
MFDNKNFYPTPKALIEKMLNNINLKDVRSILEPSAGKGDIVDYIKDKLKYEIESRYYELDLDCIEIDKNLQAILKSKNHKVIHDDFLTLNTYKNYDLIVMNPPFDTGDKHILKAIELLEGTGGQLICLLNAETINNSYSNTRKELVNKLELYNADIQFLQDSFIQAERKTNVGIALVKVKIPNTKKSSLILDKLDLEKQEEQYNQENSNNSQDIVSADFLEEIIARYNYEIKAGLKLIDEYDNLKELMQQKINKGNNSYNNVILQLSFTDKESNYSNKNKKNEYIKQVRYKYWEALFNNEQFVGNLTTNLRSEFLNKIQELREYDFSLYNIATLKIEINSKMMNGVEDTILELFEEFSAKHSYYDEMSKNIHMYNGWKTNKAWKINKKVITLISGYDRYDNSYNPTSYRVVEKLENIEKVFNYLNTEDVLRRDIRYTLEDALENNINKKIELTYFTVTFYKKGTCHIEFTNEKLLHKFNLFGSMKKGWLPPVYGKEKYSEMNKEQQEVVNQFEGEKSYKEVMNDLDYYIVNTNKLLRLNSAG